MAGKDSGLFPMFATWVPGIFISWNHPRQVILPTSRVPTLSLADPMMIDPGWRHLPDGTRRLR